MQLVLLMQSHRWLTHSANGLHNLGTVLSNHTQILNTSLRKRVFRGGSAAAACRHRLARATGQRAARTGLLQNIAGAAGVVGAAAAGHSRLPRDLGRRARRAWVAAAVQVLAERAHLQAAPHHVRAGPRIVKDAAVRAGARHLQVTQPFERRCCWGTRNAAAHACWQLHNEHLKQEVTRSVRALSSARHRRSPTVEAL